MELSFTTTATCRPGVYHKTLSSFSGNLVGAEMEKSILYLNVDPIPDRKRVDDVVEVARFFFREVRAHRANVPSFPAAVKWCWSKPTTEFFFHLEDDWILNDKMHIGELWRLFEGQRNLVSVSLRAYQFPPGDSRICLSPGLFKTEHAKVLASRLVPEANPEKQLRPVSKMNPLGGKQEGYVGRQYPRFPVIEDIGREWLRRMKWQKERPAHFTTWKPI